MMMMMMMKGMNPYGRCSFTGDESEVDVVRGDIILLETGDVVPADLRLITASDLHLGIDADA